MAQKHVKNGGVGASLLGVMDAVLDVLRFVLKSRMPRIRFLSFSQSALPQTPSVRAKREPPFLRYPPDCRLPSFSSPQSSALPLALTSFICGYSFVCMIVLASLAHSRSLGGARCLGRNGCSHAHGASRLRGRKLGRWLFVAAANSAYIVLGSLLIFQLSKRGTEAT